MTYFTLLHTTSHYLAHFLKLHLTCISCQSYLFADTADWLLTTRSSHYPILPHTTSHSQSYLFADTADWLLTTRSSHYLTLPQTTYHSQSYLFADTADWLLTTRSWDTILGMSLLRLPKGVGSAPGGRVVCWLVRIGWQWKGGRGCVGGLDKGFEMEFDGALERGSIGH